MQNRKEEFIEFVKTIKNKVHDWWVCFESRHLWIARLIVYFTCLAVVISVCFILFHYFNLFHTDVTSARYMLSAVVQTQSAIVAIVITLTLIAVQLTASAYSPRVIDIFKKNPDMWILLGCYAVSIFYGFLILKLVEGTEGEAVSQSAIWSLGSVSISFESCVSLAYWLGVFTFVVLFLYMWNIISLLKPENIIRRLAIEITRDKILNSKEDPIQPIADIIHGSIMNDLETTRVGLKTVTDQVIKIIGQDDEVKISEHFCDHLMRVSRLAISREDDESTTEVTKNLEYFWKSAAEKGLEGVASQAAEYFVTVGITAGKKGLEGATRDVARSLEDVGKTAGEKGLEDETWHAVRSLGEVGKAAAEKSLVDATMQAARSLGVVGKTAGKKGLVDSARRAAWLLREVGKVAADKGLEKAARYATRSLEEAGKAAAKERLGVETRDAVKSLGEVGKAVAEKGLVDATQDAARSLGEVGKAAAKERFGVAAQVAVVSLGEVGKAAAEKSLEDATRQAALSLGEVGKAAAENVLPFATQLAARSLGEVGKAAAERGLERAALNAAQSIVEVGKTAAAKEGLEYATRKATAETLAKLTIVSGEIVKTAIHDYESKLKEQDRDSFQKFMKIYEQELEKLRAKK